MNKGVARGARTWLQPSLLATALLVVLTMFAPLGSHSAQAAPRDRLVLGLPLEPPNLDPTSGAAAAVDEVVYGNVFEGLTKLTQNGAVAPALAESWEAAPDGLTWTFRQSAPIEFACNVPGHYQAGMVGPLTIE
ncbi:MAG: hypothetical protein RSG56_03810 [Brevundimonas sp.]